MWTPEPMQMSLLPEFYASRQDGSVLEPLNRSVYPLGAQQLIAMHDKLIDAASNWPADRPIVTFHSITRDNAFQYRLVQQNRPKGVPTAIVGSSMHAYGLAVDINTQETMRRINDAEIDMSFQEFRQYLAGFGIMGIKSESWHYNLMLRPQYYEWSGSRLRDFIYSKNWTDLSDEQKLDLLRLAGATATNLRDAAIEFQSAFSESLQVDGVPGEKTMRAAYIQWAHRNFAYTSL